MNGRRGRTGCAMLALAGNLEAFQAAILDDAGFRARLGELR